MDLEQMSTEELGRLVITKGKYKHSTLATVAQDKSYVAWVLSHKTPEEVCKSLKVYMAKLEVENKDAGQSDLEQRLQSVEKVQAEHATALAALASQETDSSKAGCEIS